MSSSAITGPVLSDTRRAPSGTAAAPSFAFNASTGTGVYLVSSDVLGLSTAGVQRVVVDASGNVGIGTASPAARLNIQSIGNWSSFNFGKGLYVSGAAGATNPAIGISDLNGTNNWAINNSSGSLQFSTMPAITDSTTPPGVRMTLDASGNLLVNTTAAPSTAWNSGVAKSHIIGGIQLSQPANTANWRQISWSGSSDGSLYFPNGTNTPYLSTAGTWTNSSDGRLKTNVTDIKYGLKAILDSKPRSYNRSDVDGDYIGFVAQELKEVIPEVVGGSDETQYGLDYGSLVAVTFKAIQEQQEIIGKLEARLAALESK